VYQREGNGPAGVAPPRSPAHRKVGTPAVDTPESSVPHAHPPTEDQDDTVEAHYSALERLRLHACYQGVVYIGHVVENPGTGEEVEVIEAVPCRRCAGDVH
jgi:hypothetical protein